MNEDFLEIDISKTKREEDLIEIRFRNEEFVQVNFLKLFSQSNYIRDKYKYSEALDLLQQEIHDIEENMYINSESIKLFIKVIEEEKLKFPVEHYKNIYTLSEYFCTSSITTELDKISCEKLFQDLNFTIQILLDYERVNNGYENKLLIKIENFLRTRINECLSNRKFKELSNSKIFRIIEESRKVIDHNLLVDFILESVSTRFIMLKFAEFDKLSYDNVITLIDFFEKQEDAVKKMYLEYIPFDLSFIKNIMNKCDQVLKEMNETKEELNKIKIKRDQKDIELNEAKEELNETKEELNKIKIKCDQKDIELNEAKEELNKIKIKCDQKDIEIKETQKELKECKKENKKVKNDDSMRKSDCKQCTQSIIVGGYDKNNGLGEKPNNNNGTPIITPPVKLPFDPSSILSYSAYYEHSVLVMSDGSLKGVGYSGDGRISATLRKTIIKDFTDFCIKDGSGRQLAAISAVCSFYGTLYMFSKSSGNERQLVLCIRYIQPLPGRQQGRSRLWTWIK